LSAGALDGLLVGLAPAVQLDDPRRDGPAAQVADPIRLGATPPANRLAPPRLGEADARVRGILGR
jgi:hypothetical protein